LLLGQVGDRARTRGHRAPSRGSHYTRPERDRIRTPWRVRIAAEPRRLWGTRDLGRRKQQVRGDRPRPQPLRPNAGPGITDYGLVVYTRDW